MSSDGLNQPSGPEIFHGAQDGELTKGHRRHRSIGSLSGVLGINNDFRGSFLPGQRLSHFYNLLHALVIGQEMPPAI
jgi:hypothetical protein